MICFEKNIRDWAASEFFHYTALNSEAIFSLQMKDRPAEDKAILGLILWFTATFTAAAAGALFRPGEWYGQLAKPAWTPPGAVFGPVWTLLYAMMAVAAWLAWRKCGFRLTAPPLRLFVFQLVLNGLWSPLFFGLHSILLGAIDLVLLWLVLLLTMRSFFKVSRLTGWLLAPYMGWVTFAAALNLEILRLNGAG
jgi:tryptophan-rich sensory protein